MTTDRILKELQKRARLSPFQLSLAKQYVEWAYAVGYDNGYTDHAKRLNESKAFEVVALDMHGNIHGPFASLTVAGMTMGVDRKCISSAIKGGHKHAGYYWRRVA